MWGFIIPCAARVCKIMSIFSYDNSFVLYAKIAGIFLLSGNGLCESVADIVAR